ncbi:MAG: hypothetical protein OSJ63_05545 [Bacilli bacterium]|nr:hypothetical protein [Bacilli bacterium]
MTNDLTIINEKANNKVSYIGKEVKTIEEKKQLFNALEKCDFIINECVGKEITVSNVYIEAKEIVDEETGEAKTKFKTILFDKEGKTYVAGAYGIYNAVVRILSIYGKPEEWTEEVKVKFIKKKIDNTKSSLTLELL